MPRAWLWELPHDIEHRHFTWSGGARAGDRACLAAVPIPDNQREYDIQHGLVDIVAHPMTITCGRLKREDFSSVYFDAHQRVLVLLQQGDVAAISTDDCFLKGLESQERWTELKGPPLPNEPYGPTINKQHPDFVAFVNAVLEQLRTDGQWSDAVNRFQQAVLAVGAQRL